jgi:hypothetical protein
MTVKTQKIMEIVVGLKDRGMKNREISSVIGVS